MATAENTSTEFIPVEELLDFLGVDEDSAGIVARLRESALEELSRSTGVCWEKEKDNKVAGELLQLEVYLAYYGQRGGIQNTEYLERRRIQLITMLQYSQEVMGKDD